MTTDDLREIAAAVTDRRAEWDLGEVLTVLHRVMTSRPGVTLDELRDAALVIAATPAARTPWALLGSGGQWSRSAGRPVQPPPMRSGAVDPDPYVGDEDARSLAYQHGAAQARAGLRTAAEQRAAEHAAKRKSDDERRAARLLADIEADQQRKAAERQWDEALHALRGDEVFGGDDPW